MQTTPNHKPLQSITMGLGEDIKEFGEGEMQQGGNSGNINTSNSNGSNDNVKDTIADSGMLSHPATLS